MDSFFLGQILVRSRSKFFRITYVRQYFFLPSDKKSDPYIFILIFFEELLVVSRVCFFRNFHAFLLNFHRRQLGLGEAVFYQGEEFVPQRRVPFRTDPGGSDCLRALFS